MNSFDHNPGQSTRGHWSRQLARWERSEHGQRAYCEANGLAVSALRWWRWRLAREQQPMSAPSALAASFIPLRVGAVGAAAAASP